MPVYVANNKDFLTIQEAAASLPVVTFNPAHDFKWLPGSSRSDVERDSIVYRGRSLAFKCRRYARQTIFKEIIATPRHYPSGMSEPFGWGPPEDAGWSADKMADRAIDVLMSHIYESWDPKALHVLMVSSGYDSRLMMVLLKRLHDIYGDEWLGQCAVCPWQPEVGYARSVFEYLGWPDDFWVPVGEFAPHEDYYEECLDFKVLGKHMCDPKRFWPGPLKTKLWLDSWPTFVNAEKVQCLSGLFADESLKWNRLQWGDIGWLLGGHFLDQPSLLPGAGDVDHILPFVSYRWLDILSRNRCPMTIDRFKLHMLGRIDPALADVDRFPNFRFRIGEMRRKNGGFEDTQRLSLGVRKYMNDRYADSAYAFFGFGLSSIDIGDHVPYYGAEIRDYVSAAIMESLIEDGVNVAEDLT